MDHDERMRDVSDKPGGRKGHAKSNTHKIRSSYRPRGAEAVLGQSSSSSRNMVNNRLLLLTSPLFSSRRDLLHNSGSSPVVFEVH